jgi:hypothetical protein
MVESLRSFSSEVTRLAIEVGTEGKLGGRAVVRFDPFASSFELLADVNGLSLQVKNVEGVWKVIAVLF